MAGLLPLLTGASWNPDAGILTEVKMVSCDDPDLRGSKTREMFEAGRSCGECLLLAADWADGPGRIESSGREVLLRSVRGLSAGRAGTCALLVAGLLAIAERTEADSARDLPSNDWLETFVPNGGPGSQLARGNPKLNEFRRRFEERVRHEYQGISCAQISQADWGTGHPVTSQAPFPDANCIRLADATVSDLNEILADVRLAG